MKLEKDEQGAQQMNMDMKTVMKQINMNVEMLEMDTQGAQKMNINMNKVMKQMNMNVKNLE